MSKWIKASLIAVISISFITCGDDDEGLLLLLPPGGEASSAGDYGSETASPVESPENNGDSKVDEIAATGDTGGDEEATGGDEGNTGGDEETAGGDEGSTGGDEGGDNGEGGESVVVLVPGGSGGDNGGDSSSNAGDSSSNGGDSSSNAGDSSSNGGDSSSAGGDSSSAGGDSSSAGGDSSSDNSATACISGAQLKAQGNQWFTNDSVEGAVHTYWTNEPLMIKIKSTCDGSRTIRLSVTAKNVNGPLPADYAAFHIDVNHGKNGKFVGAMDILASDTENNTGMIEVELKPGANVWKLNWTNDSYSEGSYDTNLQINEVKVEVVDNSSLAAFLGNASVNPWFLLITFLVAITTLTILYTLRSRNAEAEGME